jgi:methylase of polypeptide subunit release factors
MTPESKKAVSPQLPEAIFLKYKPNTVNKNSDMGQAVEWLMEGKYVLLEDEYSTGLNLLSELKKRVFSKSMKENFKKYRSQRSAYHFTSNNLLTTVSNGEVDLEKAPEIGWLELFYPESSEIYLSFPQIQGLNSSWQWYINGIQYPVLSDKIHPYYGVYFPTRFDHLLLFESWIKQQKGKFESAMDIGAGCGVLSFQMLKHGIKSVVASDINPNAIISVQKDIERMGLESSKLITVQSDLFEGIDGKSDLIVFNPPWLPAQKEEEGLDQAIYYESDLFDRFFSEAVDHLNDNGRIVILFSNLALVEGYSAEHPVISELALNNRFKKVELIKRKSAQKSKKTKRRDNRKNEYIELWELQVKP